MATTSPLSVTFTATPLDGGQTAALAGKLPLGAMVLEGWTFTAGGYTAGNPVYLSLGIGGGYSGEDLAVWHFDGSGWAPYSAGDLTYDGTYASFTVTGFSGYAVATPEPGTLGVVGLGVVGLMGRRRGRGGLRTED